MKKTKLIIRKLATLLLFMFACSATSQIVVNSLSALKPYLNDSNVNIKLSPGTYWVTVADVNNGLYDNFMDIEGVQSAALFLFEGSNSTYDFTNVTINVETGIFQAYGSIQVYEVHVVGNNNVLKNLTLVDNGSVDDHPTKGAVNLVMDGSYNTIEGFHVTSKGSYPYGYGDAFGKGGSGNVIGHRKHSTFLVRGDYNHAKNCTLIHRTYGHCIFMQAANHPTIEGCYVEGEVRTTDDMLAEEGTGTPGDNVDFITSWGYKLPAGYMMSLGEEGIRSYNAGETIINGVSYSRGTNDITVLNSTVKYMRGGITIQAASGTKYVEGCTVIGCEQGYAIGSGDVVDCYADVAYGPAYQSTYDNDNDFNADITILPASSYYNGSKSVAYIGSDYSNVTLRSSETSVNQDLKIQLGGDHKNIRFLNGNLPSQNNHTGYYVNLENFTNYPVVISSGTNNNTGQSCGVVTDSGTNNSITRNTGICPDGSSTGGSFKLVKRNATGFAIDGGSGGANGQSIELYTNVNHNNLTWIEIDRGDGYYSYQKKNTNYCIDGGNGGANGQDVYLWECSEGNQNQHWQKIDAGNGHYRLQKRGTNFSIDGGNGGAINQNVYLWSSSSTNQNQQWRFDNVSSSKSSSTKILELEGELEAAAELFNVYPNPVKNELYIELNDGYDEETTIAVYNVKGQKVKTAKPSKEVKLDLSGLQSGVYILRLDDKAQNVFKKIIKI